MPRYTKKKLDSEYAHVHYALTAQRRAELNAKTAWHHALGQQAPNVEDLRVSYAEEKMHTAHLEHQVARLKHEYAKLGLHAPY